MESHEALKDAIGPHVRDVAKRLRRSPSLIYKWTEPAEDPDDSGAHNPLDTLDEIIDEAQRRGRGELALAPIYWLNHEHGLVAFRMPVAGPGGAVNRELLRSIKEFSELAQAAAEALADGRVSSPELKRIEREGTEALRAISALMQVAKECVR